jgi:hypothetical protein
MLTICSVVLAPRGQSEAACGQPAQRNRYGALIEMWPDSRLESLICQRPGLAADYRLRWTGEMRSDPNPQFVALADRRSRRQAAARGRATGRGVVSGPASGTGPSGGSNTRMLPAAFISHTAASRLRCGAASQAGRIGTAKALDFPAGRMQVSAGIRAGPARKAAPAAASCGPRASASAGPGRWPRTRRRRP